MRKLPNYRDIWQSFAVLLPVQTVGVMGDSRTYENVVALRVVESPDGMTADWVAPALRHARDRISNRIINEVRGVNRVVLRHQLQAARDDRVGITLHAEIRSQKPEIRYIRRQPGQDGSN